MTNEISKFEIAYNDPKLYFIYKDIKAIKNIKILELGVRKGISTSLFLKLCEENNEIPIDVSQFHVTDELFNNKICGNHYFEWSFYSLCN